MLGTSVRDFLKLNNFKSIASLTLQLPFLGFLHELKTILDTQPHRLSNYCILQTPIGLVEPQPVCHFNKCPYVYIHFKISLPLENCNTAMVPVSPKKGG